MRKKIKLKIDEIIKEKDVKALRDQVKALEILEEALQEKRKALEIRIDVLKKQIEYLEEDNKKLELQLEKIIKLWINPCIIFNTKIKEKNIYAKLFLIYNITIK